MKLSVRQLHRLKNAHNMGQQIAELYQQLSLYIKKRVNNQADAEDLTQEVFYKLSKSDRDHVKSIKSWVYTIAKNTITDYYRKKKVITSELGNIPFFEEPHESDQVKEMESCINQFIQELPENYRTIMVLSELEGVPQKEIAAQLNINYTTVRSKVQRGRKKLKKLISDCCVVTQGGKGSILDIKRRTTSPSTDQECCD